MAHIPLEKELTGTCLFNPPTYNSFKSTGVREIDLILSAFSARDTDDKIQVVADKAARVWKNLWANGIKEKEEDE